MAIDLLIKEAQGLSDSALMEVLHFIRFIKNEESETYATDKAEKKAAFLKSAGKIRIDAKAVSDLRERSMI